MRMLLTFNNQHFHLRRIRSAVRIERVLFRRHRNSEGGISVSLVLCPITDTEPASRPWLQGKTKRRERVYYNEMRARKVMETKLVKPRVSITIDLLAELT